MNYRAFLVSIAFLFSLLISSAQSVATYYFAKDGSYCDKEVADSYKKTRLENVDLQRYSFEDYSMDGTLKMKGYFLHGQFSHKTGTHTEYYKNGNRKSKGTYLSDGNDIIGQKVNGWYYWRENGLIQLEELYGLDKTTNTFKEYTINVWDTAGIQKVVDGNGDCSFREEYLLSGDSIEEITFSGSVKYGRIDGIWKGYYADGTLFCEETYNSEGLVRGKSYDRNGTSYTYNEVEVKPEFNGGDSARNSFLHKNMNYPLWEISEQTNGKVLVRIVIDKTGKVKDAKIMRPLSPSIDKEALRVVKMLPDFKPGKLRGRTVSVNYDLPLVYQSHITLY